MRGACYERPIKPWVINPKEVAAKNLLSLSLPSFRPPLSTACYHCEAKTASAAGVFTGRVYIPVRIHLYLSIYVFTYIYIYVCIYAHLSVNQSSAKQLSISLLTRKFSFKVWAFCIVMYASLLCWCGFECVCIYIYIGALFGVYVMFNTTLGTFMELM